jgi:hypothetical protein
LFSLSYDESDWEQTRKEIIMNKTTKIILIVIGSLLVLCACASAVLLGTGAWSLGKLVQFAENNTTENPQKVAQIASEIAAFDIPEGFNKQYGMKFGELSLVQYMTDNERTVIFVTQFPAGTSINVDEMMRQIQQNSRRENRAWYGMTTALVEQKPVTIRGQETTMSISEGTNDQGMLYRMASAEFQGNGKGPAVVMIVGPADEWDIKTFESLIASIQ